ncbi:tetra-peptide repeat homeobox protein 1-like [Diorhabda sublineata]|uniref:tetra-peptide repeat homeobox protein 1-like n=1 Tax=Diorhabda sublineata TaxID=1163346 RepID=UPI0024E04CF3|nr:tetra-peptide repeat homeobox protein 1-like [Diorhabda sublineata]
MHSKIVLLLLLTINVLEIKSSVVPVAPPLRYTLISPQNIRPFAAQVSTFTKGLDVLSAPLAAGVLNPPAIVTKTIGLPPLVPGPAPIALPGPIPQPTFFPAPLPGPIPAPIALPTPVASPVALPAPGVSLSFAAPSYVPAPPAHVLPFPNARSVHAVAPAVGPTLW